MGAAKHKGSARNALHSILDQPRKSQRNHIMKIAIFSDIHDNARALETFLTDAEGQGADRLYCLGDVGHSAALFDRLHGVGIDCTFGNWEVSGLARMAAPRQAWVGAWSARRAVGDALLCHATPDMPAAAATTEAAAAFMRTGVRWPTLFPRLDANEEAGWQALAVLEESNVRVAFHGHTHVQKIWSWEADSDGKRRLRSTQDATSITLAPGTPDAPNRTIVGVGSIGQPQDGPSGKYVIWDQAAATVTYRILTA